MMMKKKELALEGEEKVKGERGEEGEKHRKNCECCPVSQLIVKSQRLS